MHEGILYFIPNAHQFASLDENDLMLIHAPNGETFRVGDKAKDEIKKMANEAPEIKL